MSNKDKYLKYHVNDTRNIYKNKYLKYHANDTRNIYKNKYLKYKNKYLALKNQFGGATNAAETVPTKCEKGEYNEEQCNEPFPCLDSDSRCLNKNGDTLQTVLQRRKNTIKDKTVSHHSLDSRGSANFPKFLKSKVFEFSSCTDITNYFKANETLINEMDKGNWISVLRNIKVNGFNFANIQTNLDMLSTKNPEYYKKVNKYFGMKICGNIKTDDKEKTVKYQKSCKEYYFMCLYKKLRDKYNKDSIEDCWYEAIRATNIDDYKYFDYFMNTTIIKKQAFYNEINLNSVTLPNSVITIGAQAFDGCTGLTSVTFPDWLQTIGWDAFSECSSLAEVAFPDALQTIGEGAFEGCSSLATINFGGGEALKTIGMHTFRDCSSLRSVTFPDTLQTIEEEAFSGCSNLASVAFPDALQTIGSWAFSRCSSLVSVVFGNALQTIGDSAFRGCRSLATIDFGDNDALKTIGMRTFQGCSSLHSVTFPKSIVNIINYAFLKKKYRLETFESDKYIIYF